MARARFIRPEFFTDEKMGSLPMEARMLYACIWCHSDLRGVFEYSAKQLRVFAFPYDEGVTSTQIQGWLESLERIGVISRFVAQEKIWGYVVRWKEHQRISGREKETGSIRPPPPVDTPWTPQGHPRDTLGTPQAPTLTLTLTPAPTPTLTPTPTPSPTTSNPATSGGGAQVNALDYREIIRAVRSGDLKRILKAHRVNCGADRMDDWIRECDTLTMATISQILIWQYEKLNPVREPSGFRWAKSEWEAQDDEERNCWIINLKEVLAPFKAELTKETA